MPLMRLFPRVVSLLLLFTGILGDVMNPLVTLVARAIESIFGLY